MIPKSSADILSELILFSSVRARDGPRIRFSERGKGGFCIFFVLFFPQHLHTLERWRGRPSLKTGKGYQIYLYSRHSQRCTYSMTINISDAQQTQRLLLITSLYSCFAFICNLVWSYSLPRLLLHLWDRIKKGGCMGYPLRAGGHWRLTSIRCGCNTIQNICTVQILFTVATDVYNSSVFSDIIPISLLWWTTRWSLTSA